MSKHTHALLRAASVALLACAACAAPVEPNPVESQSASLTMSTNGTIMPFGGQDGTCLAVAGASNRIQIATCGGSGQQFTFNGVNIGNTSTPGMCLDLNFGTLTDGNPVSMVSCNGGINQQWSIVGGQIASFNRGDGQTHCIDVNFANHNLGTPIDIARCNNSIAQVFWTAGPTMKFASTMSHQTANPSVTHPECLDVLFDNETVGAALDDSDCNGGQAQWYVLDSTHHVHLANNQNLCLGITGFLSGIPNGFTVGLVNCADSGLQEWFFTNMGRNATGGLVSLNNFGTPTECFDIQFGSNASPTPVDAFTCNNSGAQQWQPTISGGPIPVNNNGGRSLSAPQIVQLYYGTWWNSPVGQARMVANQNYVASVVGYINGVGAPANQKPFLRQYGVNSASLGRSSVMTDTLARSVNVQVTNATIIVQGSVSSMTINNFSFDTSHIGGSITINGARNAANNAAFIITDINIQGGHTATIKPAPFNQSAPPVTETLPNSATAWISKPGQLSNYQANGGANSLEAIVANARTAGLVPGGNNNVLILVFPSFDFSPNHCGSFSQFTPSPNSACDGQVSGAYHLAETSGAQAAFGVLFERIDEPGDRMNGGTSHEIFEAVTDPFWNLGGSSPFTWVNGDASHELCDGPCTAGSTADYTFTTPNGIKMSTGFDNTMGGACTSTGFIPR